MEATTSSIDGVVLSELKRFADDRGFFMELFNARRYSQAGAETGYVQDNFSVSKKHVIRGIHYQIEKAQGKLVTVLSGAVLDVVVDLRRSSPTFGSHEKYVLSAENALQLYVPPGCGHGFCALEEGTAMLYKCTDIYHPQHERTVLWNDPELGIAWPTDSPIVSAKDAEGKPLREAELPQ